MEAFKELQGVNRRIDEVKEELATAGGARARELERDLHALRARVNELLHEINQTVIEKTGAKPLY